ncbi:hypothetical protein AOLI_G00073470 [Acnodon oligacanthus]
MGQHLLKRTDKKMSAVCSGCSCGSRLETTPREVVTDCQTRLSIRQLKNNNNLLKTAIELSKLYGQKSK